MTLICAAVLLLIVLSATFAPWLGLADPYKTSMIRRLYPLGSPNFLLGTDELGRDMFSRLIYGGRLSLFMGVTPVVLRAADRRPRSASPRASWAAGSTC